MGKERTIREGTNCHQNFLLDGGALQLKQPEVEGHHTVGVRLDLSLQLLGAGLKRAAEVTLKLDNSFLVVAGHDLSGKGLLETLEERRQQLRNEGKRILGRVLNQHVEGLVRRAAQEALIGVIPAGMAKSE